MMKEVAVQWAMNYCPQDSHFYFISRDKHISVLPRRHLMSYEKKDITLCEWEIFNQNIHFVENSSHMCMKVINRGVHFWMDGHPNIRIRDQIVRIMSKSLYSHH